MEYSRKEGAAAPVADGDRTPAFGIATSFLAGTGVWERLASLMGFEEPPWSRRRGI